MQHGVPDRRYTLYYLRVTRFWNLLPTEVVQATSPGFFIRDLNIFLRTQGNIKDNLPDFSHWLIYTDFSLEVSVIHHYQLGELIIQRLLLFHPSPFEHGQCRDMDMFDQALLSRSIR